MKLEPNMYIRTKEGKVDKVLEINTGDFDEPVVRLASFPIGMYQGMFEYEKANYDLLELIEPMDLMYIDISPDNCGGIVVPRIAETLNELEKWKERIKSGDCKLVMVVTSQQISSVCYEVD